jgi:hypothetical protein
LLRAVFRASAYWEFGVAHLVNFLLFATSLLGFEYFTGAMRVLGRTHWDKPGLDTTWGAIGAYAVFAVFTLMMTPLVLPTPDLLVSAASFFVFGALLRLRYDLSARAAGLVLGVGLAAGSLAKSFVIPWAGICLVTAFVALRGRAVRPAINASALWLIAVVPWTAGLSAKYGHVTFGDTGRLTYVWYVNRVESPSSKAMPSAAGTVATDSILPGTAITADTPGTNPVWYDPARWYGDLRPRFSLARQLSVIGILGSEYIASLAPMFLVIAFWLIAAGRDGVREWWRRTWPVVVPALAALLAYSIVLVTTRYVAPFYMTLLLAIGVPLILMVATPNPGKPMALVNAAVGSVAFVWLARKSPVWAQIGAGVIGAIAVRMLQPFADLRWVTLMSVALIVTYWLVARQAEQRGEASLTSTSIRRSLVSACAVLALSVAGLKYADSLQQEMPIGSGANDNAFAAERAATAGIGAGSRIALVGSPFEAYWVRVARAKIVAVVPPPRMGDFVTMPVAQRQRLYDTFAHAGADFIVVQLATPPEGTDASWMPIQYIGWVKKLR